MLGFTGFYRVLSGFYWVLLGLTGFSLCFTRSTGFYWVLPGFTGFYRVLTGFYWVLLGFTWFYWVLPGFTGFYWVLPGFTGFYWVLLGCTGLYLVTSALLANRQLTDGKVAAHRQGEPVGKTKQVGGKLKTKRRSPQKVKKKRDKTPKGK